MLMMKQKSSQIFSKLTTSSKKDFFSTAFMLICAIALAVLITLFGFQSYKVDGQSMENALINGDILIISKYPRTLARITGHPYIPARGDIVVFDEFITLSNGSPSANKRLIKRVIGLPGERVVVRDQRITIYNQQYPNGFDPDALGKWHLPNVSTPNIVDVTLAPNQLFVCGDNRSNSTDSRVFGPIHANQIIGKLSLRILPPNHITAF